MRRRLGGNRCREIRAMDRAGGCLREMKSRKSWSSGEGDGCWISWDKGSVGRFLCELRVVLRSACFPDLFKHHPRTVIYDIVDLASSNILTVSEKRNPALCRFKGNGELLENNRPYQRETIERQDSPLKKTFVQLRQRLPTQLYFNVTIMHPGYLDDSGELDGPPSRLYDLGSN